MKRFLYIGILLIIFGTACICGCGNKSANTIAGVDFTTDNTLIVTFRLPENKVIEDVLGCSVGEEHKSRITTNLFDLSTGKYYKAKWCKTGNGGLLSRFNDIYRYTAVFKEEYTDSLDYGETLLYENPSEDELLNPDDAKIIEAKYGIKLELIDS